MAERARGVRAGAAIAAILVGLLVPAGAAVALEDGDRSALRSAVDRQIEAFRADDAAGAFALASPALREMFVSPDRFMGMVRQGYRPVYRPKSYEFGETRDAEAGPELSVRIDDADGIGWTAVYSFERQPDGTWAISGCRLVRAPDQSV